MGGGGADCPLVQEVSGELGQACDKKWPSWLQCPPLLCLLFPPRLACMPPTIHVCLQCRMECCDVPAETLYDVLHDIEYRKKWDSNVIETFDIARLTVNADVGYYSCEQAQNRTLTPQPPTRPPPLTFPPCSHSCGWAAQRPAR